MADKPKYELVIRIPLDDSVIDDVGGRAQAHDILSKLDGLPPNIVAKLRCLYKDKAPRGVEL